MFSVTAVDIYNNMQNTSFTVERSEVDPPMISILAPYASDDGEIYLDTEEPNLYVEGKISDESLVKTILIDGISASFGPFRHSHDRSHPPPGRLCGRVAGLTVRRGLVRLHLGLVRANHGVLVRPSGLENAATRVAIRCCSCW